MNAADPKQAIYVPASHRLAIVTDAAGAAIVERYRGDVLLDKTAIGASATVNFGEYLIDVELKVSCLTGTLTATLTRDTGPVRIRGAQSNVAATAGDVGEVKSVQVLVGSPVTLTTATAATITSLSLGPGNWEVWGVADYNLTGATTTNWDAGISTTTNNIGAQGAHALEPIAQTTATAVYSKETPCVPMSLAATTTVYMVGYASFSAGSIGAFGTLYARRVA